MYLTYDDYKAMGGTIEDESVFNDYEFQARSQIDWYTFNRLQNETEYPEAVTRCMYYLIKLLQERARAMVSGGISEDGNITAGVASQSNDGVTISFNTLSASDLIDKTKDEIRNCIQTYLGGVKNSLGHKLLYRGIYEDE